ncbi:hypothetical protein LTR78_003329 [Recurvomyces mirabilis]|uniref:Uncharacterized protein n=1 Tax=Recurvomyces mirabilis TaxID=574656 RepID=A0AAE0WSC9_9PEZI|nr:hypothetical protein LTR78_003329 [Recurvomyces mirabilis]KAK5156853.1 hypothetical protein LTS14_004370 [Recurvomyces mirabilis]
MNFKWNINNASTTLAAVGIYANTVMPAELTMRMYTSTGSSYFEGMDLGEQHSFEDCSAATFERHGLSISGSTQTDFLSAFKHYSYTSNTDFATDPSLGTSAKNFAN